MINKLHLAMIELYSNDAKRIQHFCKVHSYAKLIAETENVDKKCLFIIETAALTHDIGIHVCEEKYGNYNGKLQEKVDLCQYFEHKKLKGYADFFNSSSSFCCGVI